VGQYPALDRGDDDRTGDRDIRIAVAERLRDPFLHLRSAIGIAILVAEEGRDVAAVLGRVQRYLPNGRRVSPRRNAMDLILAIRFPKARTADDPAIGLHAAQKRLENPGRFLLVCGFSRPAAELVLALAAQEDFQLPRRGHGRGPPLRSGPSSSPFA